jgi:hypothetical protein
VSVTKTFAEIRRLLNSEKIHECSGGTLSVLETGRQATLKQVHIVSVGATAFSIRYDECGFPSPKLFASALPVHRGCDAIAFCEIDGKPFVMCVELKSSEPTRHEVTEQFRSAHCFLRYLDTLLEHYCDCEPISNWERRYFVFHNQLATPLAKPVASDGVKNTSPESALFVAVHSGQKFYVRKLLGQELQTA